ncbi:MAG: guanylate kinase [Chloroflexi bacterium]|nr:guanylate kinase [Chloroflexota bacterium]
MTQASRRGGILFVLSGPSGVGKDAVITALKREGFPLCFIVTLTTRAPRPGEVDGVNYRFVSAREFERLREEGELIEWAMVHSNVYGTPKESVGSALRRGEDVLLKVDVHGAAAVRAKAPQAVLIFLAPPSKTELIERLQSRGTESATEQAARLEAAQQEMDAIASFDYVVVNYDGRLDETVANIKAIIVAERLRVHPRRVSL